jgi:hypothetical protein
MPVIDVHVRLLADPCLWCWEIADPADGAVLYSSWISEWSAYESPEAALEAGRMRLGAREPAA